MELEHENKHCSYRFCSDHREHLSGGCVGVLVDQDANISRAQWALVRKQSLGAADVDKICRAYAASFYESVTRRQAVARCVNSAREFLALDFEVNAFNELLAAKCGG